jgi:predicted RNase H-like HicB family nuclease
MEKELKGDIGLLNRPEPETPMVKRPQTLVLRYFIEGSGQSWHAICVDLDISAQGESLPEVEATLNEMVDAYLETVMSYPEEERRQLLSRKAPLLQRAKFVVGFFLASVFASRGHNDKLSLIRHHACPA